MYFLSLSPNRIVDRADYGHHLRCGSPSFDRRRYLLLGTPVSCSPETVTQIVFFVLVKLQSEKRNTTWKLYLVSGPRRNGLVAS